MINYENNEDDSQITEAALGKRGFVRWKNNKPLEEQRPRYNLLSITLEHISPRNTPLVASGQKT